MDEDGLGNSCYGLSSGKNNMQKIYIPPALVLGCNTPHGINVLSDYIEEQTGCTPDFTMTGWSDNNVGLNYYGYGDGDGYGYGNGNGSDNDYSSDSSNNNSYDSDNDNGY